MLASALLVGESATEASERGQAESMVYISRQGKMAELLFLPSRPESFTALEGGPAALCNRVWLMLRPGEGEWENPRAQRT